MKTLINKVNPQIRITAPEIEDAAVYGVNCRTLHSTQLCLFKDDWTLVEEKSVDLEKEIDKTFNECTDGYNFDWDRFARHFYNLGRNSLEFIEKHKEKI